MPMPAQLFFFFICVYLCSSVVSYAFICGSILLRPPTEEEPQMDTDKHR